MVRKQQQKRNRQNMQPDTSSDSSTALVDTKELEELVSRAVKTNRQTDIQTDSFIPPIYNTIW